MHVQNCEISKPIFQRVALPFVYAPPYGFYVGLFIQSMLSAGEKMAGENCEYEGILLSD